MRKTLLPIIAATVLLSGIAAAQTASTTTTTTWSNDYGTTFREYSTTKSYPAYTDPALNPSVGVVLPETVKVYSLPPTITVPQAETYSYTIINNNPVVVETQTRKVIQTWQ
jgi:hypothetical protein